jgi:hypothetical protein
MLTILLLYRIARLDLMDVEFVAQLQAAVNDWVYLVHAPSGGHIKRAKSFWYLTLFDFVNGVATPRPLSSMTSLSLTIPQPGGVDVLFLSSPTTIHQSLSVCFLDLRTRVLVRWQL